MSEGLDFSDLTDDQLVELAGALAHEALRRGPATAAAFKTALVSEKERAQAMAKGAQQARENALRQMQEIARKAEAQQQSELMRQKKRDMFAVFLRQAAEITGRPVNALTLVWHASFFNKGPQLHLNAGTTGAYADWHLLVFEPNNQSLRLTPSLRPKTGALLQWAREASAAAAVLETIIFTLTGVEL